MYYIQILLPFLIYVVFVNSVKFGLGDETERSDDDIIEKEQTLIGHQRIKRSKYYSSPPPGARLYRRPYFPPFPKGAFSYTPPPNYMREDDDSHPQNNPYNTKPSRDQPSRKPQNEGLGDEDINNLVKYLSKQDLDKIIDFAGERGQTNNRVTPDLYEQQNSVNDGAFNLNGPYVRTTGNKPSEYSPSNNNINYKPQDNFQNIPFEAQESMYHKVYLNGAFVNSMVKDLDYDSSNVKEEILPKPLNLRNDYHDNEGDSTRNYATLTRPDPSYKVESFSDLPIMDSHHSKRFSVSSYKVPHYSITSSASISEARAPRVEPAPDASAARANSDAHLKAVKIWTHKSRGHAYTLHDDGSLSVERPLRPRPIYGPSH